MRRLTRVVLAAVFVLNAFCVSRSALAIQTLADLGRRNGSGTEPFDSLCCGFTQQAHTDYVTLSGNTGWGIADVNTGGIDLSDMLDHTLRVRVRPEAGNTAQNFTIALLDESGSEAKWWFNSAAQATDGAWNSLTAFHDIGSPTHGTGNWQNLDMTDIRQVRVLGHFNHPDPFEMSFDSIELVEPGYYHGSEPDAAWRQVAADRIEQNRMGDVEVRVVDSLGRPVGGAQVGVHMQKHAFGFGSAVQAYRLRDNHPRHQTYKDHVAQLFNIATIENNLKWPAWDGLWGSNFTQSGAVRAADWLQQQRIDVRGHNVIWPGADNLPPSVAAWIDRAPLDAQQADALRGQIADRIESVVGTMAGSLAAWDVINEPRANHDLMDILPEGNQAMVDWFTQAREHDAEATLYLNDYGILTSAGNTNTLNQQIYFDTIEYLQQQGAPIGGIGFQGHFSENDLTGPEALWQIFDRFATLGMEMQVTEFDFSTDDEALQAAFTRDFLTAAFAHDAIDSVLTWGFWEDAHWRPSAAMFRSDWSVKPNGQAFMDLVFDQWWTEEQLTTDDEGYVESRGFLGDYEMVVLRGGREMTFSTSLEAEGLVLEVTLPMATDFNGDGSVDRADVAVWQAGYGTLTGALHAEGDADDDGDVDGDDLLDTLLALGTKGETPGVRAVATGRRLHAIPEPTTLGLLIATVLLCAFSRRLGATFSK